MQILKSILFPSCFPNLPSELKIPVLFHFYSSSSTSISNPFLHHYLIKTLNLPKTKAVSISNLYSSVKSLEKPQSVVHFLQNVGFSDSQISSSVQGAPKILFLNVEKILKPKIEFFQELGLVGSHLGKFLSKNPCVLYSSLDKRLIPCIKLIKQILVDDEDNDALIKVLHRSSRLAMIDPQSRLLPNIQFLESCGIAGPQLSKLLTRQPRIFLMQPSAFKDFVSRVLDMGFSTDSRILVHGIHAFSCLSEMTFKRKIELLGTYGFSQSDCMDMFRRTPGLIRVSEEKLKLGIQFFMETIKFDRMVLVARPGILMFSFEERVFPRYRVLEILNSKKLLKKEPSFLYVLADLTEEEFLEKFVSRFEDDAADLLIAYKARLLDTSDEEEIR
ncbi:hypothetical protein SLA2020_410800 [Shorea laevis]